MHTFTPTFIVVSILHCQVMETIEIYDEKGHYSTDDDIYFYLFLFGHSFIFMLLDLYNGFDPSPFSLEFGFIIYI